MRRQLTLLKRGQPAFGLQEPRKLYISGPENFSSSKGKQAPSVLQRGATLLLRALLWARASSHKMDLSWMDQEHGVLLPRIQALDPAGHICTACKSHWARQDFQW